MIGVVCRILFPGWSLWFVAWCLLFAACNVSFCLCVVCVVCVRCGLLVVMCGSLFASVFNELLMVCWLLCIDYCL